MMQLGSIAFYVADVAATVEFYREAFGIECRYADPAGNFADMDTGDTVLTFVSERMERVDHLGLSPNRLGGNAPGVVIALFTGDVDHAYARAIATPGAENASEPYDKMSGERAAHVRDLNGLTVELTTIPERRSFDANCLEYSANAARLKTAT